MALDSISGVICVNKAGETVTVPLSELNLMPTASSPSNTSSLGPGSIPKSSQSTFVASGIIELENGQIRLNNYTSKNSFTGNAIGLIGFDSSGNLVTYPISNQPTQNSGATQTIVSGTFNGTPFTIPVYNSAGDDVDSSNMNVSSSGNWYLGQGNPFFKFGVGLGSMNIDQGSVADAYRMNGKVIITVDREKNEVFIGNTLYNATNIETLKTKKVVFDLPLGGTISDIGTDTSGDFTLIKPAKNGTYAVVQDIIDTAWLLTANTLTAKSFLGSVNNFDVGFKRNNVEYFTLDVNGISSLKDITSSGNLTLQKGNPRLRLRDTGSSGHTGGFDLHVNGDEFLIDDNTHSKNILRNYLNGTVHTTDFDAEVYNFKNGATTYARITSTGFNLPYLNPSQLIATDASDNLVSLSTATYPSLAELAFVKGVTSSVQTQINSKFNTPTGLTTNFLTKWSGAALSNSQIFDNGTNVGIGITPSFKLDISGDKARIISSANPQWAAQHSTNNVIVKLQALTSSGLIGTESNHPLELRTNNAIRAYINETGSVGIGTTGLTGFNLRVSKTLTGNGGNTAYGISSDGIIQNDITTAARYFYTTAQTAASTILSHVVHYETWQGTFGSGSIISNQTGFWAREALIGGVNNYGFRGNIPAGTNRWNLFLDGTAQNHFRGNVGIGASSTVPTTELEVRGVISASLGSSALPSYTFVGDLNNGWWSPSADVQAWSLSGAEAMRLNATGLGIGVTPTYRLDVAGTGHFTGAVQFDTVPSSLQDATTSNHLVRYSQWIASTSVKYLPTAVNTVSLTNVTSLSGVQNINGVTGVAGTTRILLTAQSSAINNGIWVMQSGAWTRATDSDTDPEIRGFIVSVSGGTFVGYKYINTNASAITINTTAITYSEFSNVAENDPIFTAWRDQSRSANTFWAAPNGSNGVATWRTLVASDVPTLNQNTTGTAGSLAASRSIAISGDLSWNVSFNGSADVTAVGTLATVNTNTGTFAGITVNQKGLVTGAVALTTLAGYGITDALSQSSASATYLTQANAASTYLTIANATANYQPLNTKLTSISSLDATEGFIYQSGANSYTKRLITAITPLNYDTVTGDLTITRSSSIANGFLHQDDWNFFNEKQGRISNYLNYSDETNGLVLITNNSSFEWVGLTTYLTDVYQSKDATLTALASLNSTGGILTQTGVDTFTKRTLAGTANRLTITNGDGISGNPTFDIASTYVGQTTITTLGNIATGTWNGTTIAINKGGTGLTTLGTANQLLRVNAGATALEYFTPTFISGNQTITLSGVVTGSGATSITTSIANGAITNAMLANGAVANLSGTNTGDNAPNSLYSSLVSNATHTGDATGATALTVVGLRGVTLPTLGLSSGLLRYTGTGTNTWVFDTSTYLTGNQSISITGDATGSGTTSISLLLASTGVTAGTYKSVTVDSKGRVTAGTNPTTIAGYGITDYNSLWDAQLATKTTTNLSEGTNLYYTQARFDTAFNAKSTTNLIEGINLYYTQARFDSAFNAKSTTNLSEGTNLYYTNARGISSVLTGYTSGAGVVSATDNILQAIQKLNGNIGAISLTSLGGINFSTVNSAYTLGTNTALANTQTLGVQLGNLQAQINAKENTITAGTTVQYWRGDKTWQTLDKASVGLGSVENIALSTWAGSTNITTLGNIGSGIWNGSTIGINKGGTGLTALGTANQLLRVNAGATALEYFTPTFISGNQNISISGDATGSGTTSIALTLVNSGVTAGTYRSVTVDLKGRVTAGTNPTTVSGYGITDFYSQVVTGFVTGANSTVLNTDSLEVALEKLQGQVNARLTGNQTITLSGDVTGTGATSITTSISNATVTGKLLTGYVSGAGVVSATDSVLSAIQKLNGNVGAISLTSLGGINYSTVNSGYALGTNVALTNTQTLGAQLGNLQAQVNARMITADNPDLVAIEALTGTTGLLRKTALNTWALDTTSYQTALSTSTIGLNVLNSTNPSAIAFLRANADNTASWLSASDYRTAIGAGTLSASTWASNYIPKYSTGTSTVFSQIADDGTNVRIGGGFYSSGKLIITTNDTNPTQYQNQLGLYNGLYGLKFLVRQGSVINTYSSIDTIYEFTGQSHNIVLQSISTSPTQAKVGISIVNPQEKLHVNGNIRGLKFIADSDTSVGGTLTVKGNSSFGLTNPLTIEQKNYVQGSVTSNYNEISSLGKWLRLNTDSGFSLRHNEIDAISFTEGNWKFNTNFSVTNGEEINDWIGFNVDDRFRIGINEVIGLAAVEMVYENSIIRNYWDSDGIFTHVDSAGNSRKYLREGDVVGGSGSVSIPNLQQVTEQGANSTIRMQFNGTNYATLSDLGVAQGLDSVLGNNNTANNKNIFLNGLSSAYTLGWDGTAKFFINHSIAGTLNLVQTAGNYMNITAADIMSLTANSLLEITANSVAINSSGSIGFGTNGATIGLESTSGSFSATNNLVLQSGTGDLDLSTLSGNINIGINSNTSSKTKIGKSFNSDFIFLNGQKYNFVLPTVSSGDYLVLQVNSGDVTVKKATIFASGGKNYLTV